MFSVATQKWIMGILATLLSASLIGGFAWAQSTHAQIAQARSDVAGLQVQAQTQTQGVYAMRETLEQIRIDVAAMRAGADARDRELERRLDRIETSVNE